MIHSVLGPLVEVGFAPNGAGAEGWWWEEVRMGISELGEGEMGWSGGLLCHILSSLSA